ncbi:MAG: sulfur carrier protein ThiS [Nitrospinae bacterium]|nr:sulfur carrier protein ThiS [Nitrospinota bacterium]
MKSEQTMPDITLNGETKNITVETIADLIKELDIRFKYILVEHNGEPVERKNYSTTKIVDGDKLEIAQPMSGG